MSDIDRYRAMLADLTRPERVRTKSNLRLPRDPKRALADMQATLTKTINHKGLNDEPTRKKN